MPLPMLSPLTATKVYNERRCLNSVIFVFSACVDYNVHLLGSSFVNDPKLTNGYEVRNVILDIYINNLLASRGNGWVP